MDTHQSQQDSTYDVALITVCVDPDDAYRISDSVERMPWAVASSSFDAYISAIRRPYFSASISAAKACVAVVDFDLDPAQAIESTKYLQQVFAGRVTVIALAESRDPDILLRAMRAGCSEFLGKPYHAAELDQTLQGLQQLWSVSAEASESGGKILSFVGVKGGVGTTTLAVHLAMNLVQIQGKRTLLIDHHPELGHVCVYLGLDGQRCTYQEVVRSVTRLDTELLRGIVSKHASGLEVLSSPDSCAAVHGMDADVIARTLKFLRSEYDYIVIDCPNSLDEVTMAVIDVSSTVYLVATPEIGAIRDLSRYVDHLTLNSTTTEKMQVVINRVSSRYAVNVDHIEKAIRLPVAIRLPNSYADLVRSANLGEPISLKTKSEFNAEFLSWSNTLVGSTGQGAPIKTKSSIFAKW